MSHHVRAEIGGAALMLLHAAEGHTTKCVLLVAHANLAHRVHGSLVAERHTENLEQLGLMWFAFFSRS